MPKRRTRRMVEAVMVRRARAAAPDAFAALRQFEQLFRRAGEAFEKVRNSRPAEAVSLLSARLADDLRGVDLLLARGYRSQAMTIGSAALEAALTIVHIGTSDVRAEEWLSHPQRFPKRLSKDRFRSALAETPWKPAVVRASGGDLSVTLDVINEVLCAAKHCNPTILPAIAWSRTLEGRMLDGDPVFSPRLGEGIRNVASMVLLPSLLALIAVLDFDVMSAAWNRAAQRGVQRHEPLIGLAAKHLKEAANRRPLDH